MHFGFTFLGRDSAGVSVKLDDGEIMKAMRRLKGMPWRMRNKTKKNMVNSSDNELKLNLILLH